jgi:stage III sporulation protein AH
MLLKKQTVWLLTMLSLVVVLSVYYITTPDQKNSNMTALDQKAKNQVANKNSASSKKSNTNNNKSVVTTVAGNSNFDEIRMEIADERSKQKAELEAEVASTNLPADKRSQAYDQMQKLNETAQKEEVLETLIKTMGYADALVQANGSKVNITVKTNKKHSASAANDIIQLAKKEIGDANYVAVEFQPSN